MWLLPIGTHLPAQSLFSSTLQTLEAFALDLELILFFGFVRISSSGHPTRGLLGKPMRMELITREDGRLDTLSFAS